MKSLGMMLVLLAIGPASEPCPNSGVPGTPYEGFGRDTVGGAGRPVYRVTTLADSGPGSLRDAVSVGGRCVVFDVAGEIVLRKQLHVRGAFVTVDGFTAPVPGISLRDHGIAIWGNEGAQEVIVRGVRIRSAGRSTCQAGRGCYDGIQVKNGARRVVIDHVSSDNASDGAIDITGAPGQPTRDVTVQWSIFSRTQNQALLHRAVRVSMHHNLFVGGQNRNPQADWDVTLATTPPDTVLDFRNNVVWNYTAYATLVRRNATANVVANYYHSDIQPSAQRALVVDRQGRAHAAGNHSSHGADVDGRGTEATEFPAAGVTVTDACRAAQRVVETAGPRSVRLPLDAADSGVVAQVAAALRSASCAGPAPPDRGPRS
jgi:hypothetical protein